MHRSEGTSVGFALSAVPRLLNNSRGGGIVTLPRPNCCQNEALSLVLRVSIVTYSLVMSKATLLKLVLVGVLDAHLIDFSVWLFRPVCWWWPPWLVTLSQLSGHQGEYFLWPEWRPPLHCLRRLKHALAVWLKTQKDSKVYCFKQELSCHTDSASQWRVCWVYTLSGEHWTGMFGGSSPETRVKRGM